LESNQVYLQVSNEKIAEIAKLNWVQNIELIAAPVESDNLPGVTTKSMLNSTIPGITELSGKG
jgi:hypothetical protein